MKKLIFASLILLLFSSCEKTDVSVAGKWYFVPVDETHKTDIDQIHFASDGSLWIWYDDRMDKGLYTNTNGRIVIDYIDNDQYTGESAHVFDIVKSTDVELIIDEKGVLISLVIL